MTQDDDTLSAASAGSVASGSLGAFLAWRDEKIANGETDLNPFMVWSAGVRYATLTDEERKAIHIVRACAMTRAERYLVQSDMELEATRTLMGLRERLL